MVKVVYVRNLDGNQSIRTAAVYELREAYGLPRIAAAALYELRGAVAI